MTEGWTMPGPDLTRAWFLRAYANRANLAADCTRSIELGGLCQRVAEPADPMDPHDRGDRLDRHLVLFHGAGLHADQGRNAEPGRDGHRLAGARRRLLSRRNIHRPAAGAGRDAALVRVGGLSHLGQRLWPVDR